MIIVKTKKELIRAIENGEKHIRVDSKKLYAACKLAESYDTVSELIERYIREGLMSLISPMACVVSLSTGAVVTITITISVLVAAIAIVGILNNKKVKIKVKGPGDLTGEIEIE